MEIQQKDKEYLAAYIHRFKREAKRCNFNDNAVTIQIFIKGLKNVHTLAAHVFEKGPQTLADAIIEVEKLQAAQQLTATLLPSSTVNVMSSKDTKCFQCQESGNIACHCPNIRCFDCSEYGHIVADCPDRIPPSRTPAHHKKHDSNTRHCIRSTSRHHTRSTSRHHHRDRQRLSRSRSQSHTCRYQVTATTTHTEVTLDLIKEAHHVIDTKVLTVIEVTCHTEGHHHTEVPPLFQRLQQI